MKSQFAISKYKNVKYLKKREIKEAIIFCTKKKQQIYRSYIFVVFLRTKKTIFYNKKFCFFFYLHLLTKDESDIFISLRRRREGKL